MRTVLVLAVLAYGLPSFPAISQSFDAEDLFDLGRNVIRNIPDAQDNPRPQPRAQLRVQAEPVQRRADVREIQANLGRLGYAPGPADGLMGPKTRTAIRQFQRDRGLAETGAPSPALSTLIDGALGSNAQATAQADAKQEPSFDCARAGTAVEHAICASGQLARKDRQLADLYAQALAQSASPDAIRQRQRAWLQERDSCGGAEACLAGVMDTRIAELGGAVFPATPTQGTDADTRLAAENAEPQAAGTAEAAATTVRDDGIEVRPGGRLLVPDPRFQTGSPDYWQHLALARHLKHAAIGVFPDPLLPSDNPALMADAARDYLALADVRPYFCTREEMTARKPDCMDFSDASYAFAMAGGTFGNGAVEARKPNPFLWWRGANEFDRKRSIAGFVDSGLRDRIVETAPEAPVRLLFKVDGVLDTYDFDAGNFPILVGLGRVAVPGSKSVAFGLAEVVQPIEIPRDKAEALQQMLESRGDGRAEIVIGVAVDLMPEQPHAGQPRWRAKVVSTDYYMDPDATVPLAGAAGTERQSGDTSTTVSETETTARLIADTSDSVLRSFDLRREDGRIVLAFDGYREPTASTQEAVTYVVASASRDLLQAVAEDHNRYNMPLLRAILRHDLRDRLLGPAGFAGETEFAARRAKTAFEEEVAPKLVAEAPPLPIPMRLYLDATLSEYDFEQEHIGLRVFQDSGLRIGGSYPISLQPVFDLVPGALPMAPDAAERLVTAADAGPGPVLRLDFDIVRTRLNRHEFRMTARPAAVALVTGENGDVVHFRETYDTAEDVEASADAARAFPGPEPVDAETRPDPAAAPEPQTQANDARSLSVVGIRLGMPRKEAMNALRDVGRVVYRAEVAPAEPGLVQDRYTLAVLDNGETFALHTAAKDDSPVIGLARKIPVGKDVPLSAIREAVVESYGEPGFEEQDGGGWTTWRWEPPGNQSDAGIPCVQHFTGGSGSGQPPELVDEIKDVDAISATFDGAAKFANNGDESFFRFYLKDRAPRLGLDMQDRLGNCAAFLNIRVMPSQTHSTQVRVDFVDPAAFAEELKTHSAASSAAEFDSKF